MADIPSLSAKDALADVLALLAERGILNRITRVRVAGIALEMTPAPVARTAAEVAREQEQREESTEAWERRISTGHAMRLGGAGRGTGLTR